MLRRHDVSEMAPEGCGYPRIAVSVSSTQVENRFGETTGAISLVSVQLVAKPATRHLRNLTAGKNVRVDDQDAFADVHLVEPGGTSEPAPQAAFQEKRA